MVGAAALASVTERRRARRRRGADVKARGHRDEYFTMTDGTVPDDQPGGGPAVPGIATTLVSGRGAGTVAVAGGLTDTRPRGHTIGRGLDTVDGGAFGGGPAIPLLPSTWTGEDGAVEAGQP